MPSVGRLCLYLNIPILLVAIWIALLRSHGPRTPVSCMALKYNCIEPTFGGYVHPNYREVFEKFQKNFYDGLELGAQLTVYVKGEKVLDVWGDYGTGYNNESLQMVFSSTKILGAFVMAVGVDRGYFRYDDPVAKHWPEFAKHGKEHITIADVLRHEAGLAIFRYPFSASNYTDLDKLGEIIADSEPRYFDGSKRAYHSLTHGLVINEIFRRADPKKRTVGKFWMEEIAPVLGKDGEFYVGNNFPETASERYFAPTQPPFPYVFANLLLPFLLKGKVPGISALDEEATQLLSMSFNKSAPLNVVSNSFLEWDGTPTFWAGTKGGRAGENPSLNGISNAATLAALAQLILNHGTFNGVSIVKPETIRESESEVIERLDTGLNLVTAFSKGGWASFPDDRTLKGYVGWGGWGGSLIQWNKEKQIALGYTITNMGFRILNDDRARNFMPVLNSIVDKN